MANKLKDLSAQRFGRLTIVKRSEVKLTNATLWECVCDCGKKILARGCNLKSGKTTSCGCFRFEEQWKGFGEISGNYWSSIVRRSKKINREVNITIQDGWNLFLEQNRKCVYTGLELSFHSNWRKHHDCQTASLDRINSDLGYIKGNVQWVHKTIQLMKNSLNESVFISMCELVAKKQS